MQIQKMPPSPNLVITGITASRKAHRICSAIKSSMAKSKFSITFFMFEVSSFNRIVPKTASVVFPVVDQIGVADFPEVQRRIYKIHIILEARLIQDMAE